MDPFLPYIACLLGAVAVFLLLRPGRQGVKLTGMLLGLGAFGWLLMLAAEQVEGVGAGAAGAGGTGAEGAGVGGVFFYIFATIAVACAVRLITHTRPVFCALYFVLVVLSSAALFLLLEAEFMAFALVIVYAGAVIITYMFVLMLAQQAANPEDATGVPEYDATPREPAFACGVGFVMLALLSTMIFGGAGELTSDREAANTAEWRQLEQMPGRLKEIVAEIDPEATLVEPFQVVAEGDAASVLVRRGEEADLSRLSLPADARPHNVQTVGLALVADFPASLELAGVILLMAMYGAVVVARRQIELGEDELREAAGLERISGDQEPRGGASGRGEG